MAYWVVEVPCAALISRVNMGSVAMGGSEEWLYVYGRIVEKANKASCFQLIGAYCFYSTNSGQSLCRADALIHSRCHGDWNRSLSH